MRFIGSKIQLLENIKQVIDENVQSAEVFCDLFSGTSCVARYFKQWYTVYSNDVLYFSYVLQKGTIENNGYMEFKGLKDIIGEKTPIEFLNDIELDKMEELSQLKRFCQNTYAPTGGRMYITDENALKIDYARIMVESWKTQGYINENEYFYLVASIVEGVPYVSNISGTYGAYHKTWDKRAHKNFELIDLEITSNNKDNRCFNIDGVELLKEISGDVLYLDPPYNARQYLPNYHVLETVAKYDYPEVKGVTGQRPYENQKSKFCSKKYAMEEFEKAITNANFKHIILSYSTDGLMNVEDIEFIMKKHGIESSFKLYEIPYRRFKSRDLNKEDKLKELLFYIQK